MPVRQHLCTELNRPHHTLALEVRAWEFSNLDGFGSFHLPWLMLPSLLLDQAIGGRYGSRHCGTRTVLLRKKAAGFERCGRCKQPLQWHFMGTSPLLLSPCPKPAAALCPACTQLQTVRPPCFGRAKPSQ